MRLRALGTRALTAHPRASLPSRCAPALRGKAGTQHGRGESRLSTGEDLSVGLSLLMSKWYLSHWEE